MTTTAPKPENKFPLAPQGTFIARCIQFIHIGTIKGEWKGEEKEFNKINLAFELPTETKVFKEGEGEKPILVSGEYTLSMGSKANLRKLVEGIIGTALQDDEAYAFDAESLVGMSCLLTIKHVTSKAGKMRAEIANAVPLMKGQTVPPQVNASKILSYDNWNESLFQELPEFLRKKIEGSKEYQAMKGLSEDVNPDEIPF